MRKILDRELEPLIYAAKKEIRSKIENFNRDNIEDEISQIENKGFLNLKKISNPETLQVTKTIGSS